MSYVRVDSSVRTNRKFLQAGPAASWLWLCGTAYCQETLTDGFIPFEALRYLGVEHPRPLIAKLITARLWDAVDGGWQVHDYLDHNKSAAQVADIKAEKREAGKRGGEASGRSRSTKHTAKQSAEPLSEPVCHVAVAASDAVAVSKEGGVGETNPPFDAMFWQLHRTYPEKRRSSGPITEQLFLQQFQVDTRKAPVVFAEMLANLETQIAGHEWRVKGMVPKLEKWLRDGLWRQRHEVAPPETLVNERTAGTLAAANEILKGRAS